MNLAGTRCSLARQQRRGFLVPRPATTYCPSCVNYSYADSTHKHAVTDFSSGESYAYDANGNMTTRTEGGVTYHQVFDAENRLTYVCSESGGTPGVVCDNLMGIPGILLDTFTYDGNGQLSQKADPSGITLYAGRIYEIHYDLRYAQQFVDPPPTLNFLPAPPKPRIFRAAY